MAKWWKRSHPTNVTWVQFHPMPYVGWVCCWVLPCSKCFSTGFPVFLPPQTPTSQNSNSTRIENPHENQLGWCGFLSKYCKLTYFFSCTTYTCVEYFREFHRWRIIFQNIECLPHFPSWSSVVWDFGQTSQGIVNCEEHIGRELLKKKTL